MQSLSAVQLVLQLVAPQTYSPHDAVVAAGQLPAPEQNDASVAVLPLHDGPLHITVVGCCWQAPPPLQAPVLPQVPPGVHRACGSVTLLATFAQAPRLPETLQAMQVPQLLLAQQTPSTQKLLPHSWLERQATPFAFTGRQLPLVPVQ
jgi:hypothetical protein